MVLDPASVAAIVEAVLLLAAAVFGRKHLSHQLNELLKELNARLPPSRKSVRSPP